MTVLPIATINAQGVTDPRDHVLFSAVLPLPGIALAFMQEVAPIRFVLRTRLSARGIGVHQSKALDRGGVALVWDRSRLEKLRTGYVLLAAPEPGDDMRRRFGAWADFQVKGTGVKFRALSGHRPLRSTGDQYEHDKNLAAWIEDSPYPVLIGEDVNGDGDNLAGVLRILVGHGLHWRGSGIDGFLVDGDLDVSGVKRLPASRSDHRAVRAELTV